MYKIILSLFLFLLSFMDTLLLHHGWSRNKHLSLSTSLFRFHLSSRLLSCVSPSYSLENKKIKDADDFDVTNDMQLAVRQSRNSENTRDICTTFKSSNYQQTIVMEKCFPTAFVYQLKNWNTSQKFSPYIDFNTFLRQDLLTFVTFVFLDLPYLDSDVIIHYLKFKDE